MLDVNSDGFGVQLCKWVLDVNSDGVGVQLNWIVWGVLCS